MLKDLIEGFYIKLRSSIMAVKGVLQPPGRVIAIPTYIEYRGGVKRIRMFDEALKYFIENFPEHYRWFKFAGRCLPAPPLNMIDEIYDPRKFRPDQSKQSKDAEDLRRTIIRESGIDESFVGVSGSILLGLSSPSSDIDLIIFGLKHGEAVYNLLKDMRRRGEMESLSDPSIILRSRKDSSIDPRTWFMAERKKLLTGVFRGRVYTAKIVPLPSEYWERLDQECRELGKASLIGEILDDSYSITTPNRYILEVIESSSNNLEPGERIEVMSMRSRFAEMASRGELVEVRGRLELIKLEGDTWKRVFLGNDLEDMILPCDTPK